MSVKIDEEDVGKWVIGVRMVKQIVSLGSKSVG